MPGDTLNFLLTLISSCAYRLVNATVKGFGGSFLIALISLLYFESVANAPRTRLGLSAKKLASPRLYSILPLYEFINP